MSTESPTEVRRAFLLWRGTSTIGRPSPSIYFDNPPTALDKREGRRILSGPHEITGDLLVHVNKGDGSVPWSWLAAVFPPPAESM